MSGFLNEAVTPCPSRSRSSGFGEHSGSETWDSLLDGDSPLEPTGQIEFTTEIRASILTGARPRRANRAGSAIQIHEDVVKSAGPAEKRRRPNGVTRPPSDRKSSLLTQPAQRFRPKVNFAPSPPSRLVKQETESKPKPRGVEAKTSEEILPAVHPKNTESSREIHQNGLKKHLRRNTVYIPPDDTTVASVFMGLFSPLKKPHGETLPQVAEDTQVNTLEARIAQRQARKSLAVSARKAPLQPSAKIAQEAATRVDIAGKNGGKENIPPGALIDLEKKTKFDQPTKPNRISTKSTSKPVRRTTTHQSIPSESSELAAKPPRKQISKRDVLGEKQSNMTCVPSRAVHERSAIMGSKGSVNMTSSLTGHASALSERLGHSASSRSSRIENMSLKLKELNHEYPMLTENISRPALYEDDWLSHQETVITQLVNALFECTNGDLATYDPNALRLELLELYHTEYFTQLYRRLQASLSCGNLSIPKDLARDSRLRQDVGVRRRFLDIWVQSYDLRALVAALETIVGRKVSHGESLFDRGIAASQENNTKRQRMMTRKLEGFLEAFLLRNDDIGQSVSGVKDTPVETQAKAYRRTVLRSIMLIVLLDQGRQSLGNSLPRRLFVPSSPFKSSVEVLQAMARLLLPSCGDIMKPLSHLGCHLSYKQHQLQEYGFQMNNLAVDLRDGVRLTRIVEVLFFASEHVRSDNEDQTEVTMSTGEALSLLGDEKDLPLSKHLKYPCISRATKIFNVQIALSALSSVRGSGTIFNDLRAEEIVDGYREKTIALLWGLVSKWGLAGLVDWNDVNKEITRLKRKALSQIGHELIEHQPWFTGEQFAGSDEHARLLQQWAAILAALKGLHISNMTTGFANGKIYESIVDEYEPYITGSVNQDSIEAGRSSIYTPLETRLRLLGCSSQFAHLVSPDAGSLHILNHEFTLGALAFLCSRLLSASKRARAATIVQRAWRARLTSQSAFRRTVAKDLAAHCAAVVQTRNEILWAKEVITRWWRKTKAQKQRQSTFRAQPLRKFNRQGQKTAGRRL